MRVLIDDLTCRARPDLDRSRGPPTAGIGTHRISWPPHQGRGPVAEETLPHDSSLRDAAVSPSHPVYSGDRRCGLPCWPGRRTTGPLTSGNASGGAFGLWQVGCPPQDSNLRTAGAIEGPVPHRSRPRRGVMGIGISAAGRTAWSALFWSGSRRGHHPPLVKRLSSRVRLPLPWAACHSAPAVSGWDEPVERRGDERVAALVRVPGVDATADQAVRDSGTALAFVEADMAERHSAMRDRSITQLVRQVWPPS
jgi:hypothetical protein